MLRFLKPEHALFFEHYTNENTDQCVLVAGERGLGPSIRYTSHKSSI